MKLRFSQQVFKKKSNIKVHENPVSGSGVTPCVQMDRGTDRHDEANSVLSKFYERA